MESTNIPTQADALAHRAAGLSNDMTAFASTLHNYVASASHPAATPFTFLLTIFVLACFVGYYVVWRVTPALHSPLMSVTNAISSVIIVGGLIAAGPAGFSFSKIMGVFAVILASVNIFGGFIVTQRMLSMFKKKTK